MSQNHAASLGGHALDGCGEFMPSSTVNPNDPRSLKCAACACHRNFHRREPQEQHIITTTATATPAALPSAPQEQDLQRFGVTDDLRSFVQDPEQGQVIQLQGDHRKNVSTFLVQAGIVKKEHIKIHGF